MSVTTGIAIYLIGLLTGPIVAFSATVIAERRDRPPTKDEWKIM